MRRLFLTGSLADTMEITGSDAHHLMHVMRAKTGQHLVVVDAGGQVAETEVTGFGADTVTLRFLQILEDSSDSPIDLVLAQCLPKADKMDFIVQKAVELGASQVQPLNSKNCVVRYDAKKRQARQQKWQRIADEAAKQCGRTQRLQVGEIHELTSWLEAAAQEQDALLLFCYEAEKQQPLGTVLAGHEVKKYFLLIGPEGGFSPEEAEKIQAAGAYPVSLGPRILRAETAALAAMSVVQHVKGDLGGRGQRICQR